MVLRFGTIRHKFEKFICIVGKTGDQSTTVFLYRERRKNLSNFLFIISLQFYLFLCDLLTICNKSIFSIPLPSLSAFPIFLPESISILEKRKKEPILVCSFSFADDSSALLRNTLPGTVAAVTRFYLPFGSLSLSRDVNSNRDTFTRRERFLPRWVGAPYRLLQPPLSAECSLFDVEYRRTDPSTPVYPSTF